MRRSRPVGLAPGPGDGLSGQGVAEPALDTPRALPHF